MYSLLFLGLTVWCVVIAVAGEFVAFFFPQMSLIGYHITTKRQ
jgi:hypothetical protein